MRVRVTITPALLCPHTMPRKRRARSVDLKDTECAMKDTKYAIATSVAIVKIDGKESKSQGIPVVRVDFNAPSHRSLADLPEHLALARVLVQSYEDKRSGIIKVLDNVPAHENALSIFTNIKTLLSRTDPEMAELKDNLKQNCVHQYLTPCADWQGAYTLHSKPAAGKVESLASEAVSAHKTSWSGPSIQPWEQPGENDTSWDRHGSAYLRDLEASKISHREHLGLNGQSAIYPIPQCSLQQGVHADESNPELNIPGITTPFVYVAMGQRSCFAMHVEDCRTCSINRCHSGEKIWFVVLEENAAQLLEIVRKMRPATKKSHPECTVHVKHQSLFFTEQFFEEHRIPMVRVVQRAGETIIVEHDALHMGYNSPYCVAEAINFTTELEDTILPQYKPCTPGKACPRDATSIELEHLQTLGKLAQSGRSAWSPRESRSISLQLLESWLHACSQEKSRDTLLSCTAAVLSPRALCTLFTFLADYTKHPHVKPFSHYAGGRTFYERRYALYITGGTRIAENKSSVAPGPDDKAARVWHTCVVELGESIIFAINEDWTVSSAGDAQFSDSR